MSLKSVASEKAPRVAGRESEMSRLVERGRLVMDIKDSVPRRNCVA